MSEQKILSCWGKIHLLKISTLGSSCFLRQHKWFYSFLPTITLCYPWRHLISVLCKPLQPSGRASSSLTSVIILCWKTVVWQHSSKKKKAYVFWPQCLAGLTTLRWESSPAYRSLVFRICWFFPSNRLQNRTLPTVSGIFPILYDFSKPLIVPLRSYLQTLLTLWNIICLDLEVWNHLLDFFLFPESLWAPCSSFHGLLCRTFRIQNLSLLQEAESECLVTRTSVAC